MGLFPGEPMNERETIQNRYRALAPALNERQRRLLAASEARPLGRGGISFVSRATGLSRRAIRRGLDELDSPQTLSPDRVRLAGGGRKKATQNDPNLLKALERLVEPTERGGPQSPLRWTCKSLRKLAEELTRQGHKANRTTVGELLHAAGYSLQANRKTDEGSSHEHRNEQFERINARVAAQIAAGEPAISVDTKKKELVGAFKNPGREWHPEGKPEEVSVYDFVLPGVGRASPHGVYDISDNKGWVSVGVDHDTAEFAVATIRRWWEAMGRPRYPRATTLLITADGGGSNGSRVRLWKVQLQQLANETGLTIGVCHLPPGTSKWNKIEHRLFSFISQNWRGKPLLTHKVIVDLIASTRTNKGLEVRCEIDATPYPLGIKVTDREMAALAIERDAFHGEWNYTIRPHPPPPIGTVIS
jgi:hypothetical protein